MSGIFFLLSILFIILIQQNELESRALIRSYHSAIFFLLPLFIILLKKNAYALYPALIIGEIPLSFFQAFSFQALIYLILLTLSLQGIFLLLQKKWDTITAQTYLPIFFYFSLTPVFFFNEILYYLSPETRSFVISTLINTNSFLLLIGSQLEQIEFFRSFFMYNYISDIGSHYPHHFPNSWKVNGIFAIFGFLSLGFQVYLGKKKKTIP